MRGREEDLSVYTFLISFYQVFLTKRTNEPKKVQKAKHETGACFEN